MTKSLMALAALCAFMSLSTAQAQGYGSEKIPCHSNDSEVVYCAPFQISRINKNSVKIYKEYSDSACVKDQTWGVGNWNIWVSHGCKATFKLSGWTRRN